MTARVRLGAACNADRVRRVRAITEGLRLNEGGCGARDPRAVYLGMPLPLGST